MVPCIFGVPLVGSFAVAVYLIHFGTGLLHHLIHS